MLELCLVTWVLWRKNTDIKPVWGIFFVNNSTLQISHSSSLQSTKYSQEKVLEEVRVWMECEFLEQINSGNRISDASHNFRRNLFMQYIRRVVWVSQSMEIYHYWMFNYTQKGGVTKNSVAHKAKLSIC